MSEVEKKTEAKAEKPAAKKAEKKAAKPAAKKAKAAAVAPHLYDVIRSPIITEKSQMASEYNKVTFRIAPEATKTCVEAAVSGIFGVEVKKVNVIVLKGKTKRFRGFKGQRNDVKKAIVTLAEGQSIDVASAIK